MSETLPPPFIFVSGIPNFRDLGGYGVSQSLPHRSVRINYIFRCGEPSRVTPDGIKMINSLGVTHMYDLRSGCEIERNIAHGKGGIVQWDECQRVFSPVFADEDYSPQKLAIRFRDYCSEGTEGFTRAYAGILENAPAAYKRILLHIADKPDSPLIIHCTAGKDRTGVLCAMILSLCGVDDQTVAYEYSLSELGLSDWKEEHVQAIMSNPLLGGDRSAALNMFGSRAACMLATLMMVRQQFGGVENYFIEKCGLSEDDLRRIRTNLTVEGKPIRGALESEVNQEA